MGVKGLWELVAPAARKVQLETLAGKRLAVDASIWLHQFLKAMRDKEGNALRNAHILGFFRRICKLLFFNIKPVFVFDGGVPELKRHTVVERRKRRTGQVNSLAKTAEKLLAAQMRLAIVRQAEKDAKKKNQPSGTEARPHFQIPENVTYMDELTLSMAQQSRKRKRDEYDLPALAARKRDDPRLADESDLPQIDEYERRKNANQDFLHSLPEDLHYHFLPGSGVQSGRRDQNSLLDISSIDLNSPTFRSLPVSTQQELLIELKLRSRQTSHARLEHMVRAAPTALGFSQAQIEQLMVRNDLTQKVMNMNQFLSGATDVGVIAANRIASEKQKQYVLMKNDDGGTGWSIGGGVKGLSQLDGTEKNRPLNLDVDKENAIDSDEEVEFEEVVVPGDDSKDRPEESRVNKFPPFIKLPGAPEWPAARKEALDSANDPIIISEDVLLKGLEYGRNEIEPVPLFLDDDQIHIPISDNTSDATIPISADPGNYIEDEENMDAVMARFAQLEEQQTAFKEGGSNSHSKAQSGSTIWSNQSSPSRRMTETLGDYVEDEENIDAVMARFAQLEEQQKEGASSSHSKAQSGSTIRSNQSSPRRRMTETLGKRDPKSELSGVRIGTQLSPSPLSRASFSTSTQNSNITAKAFLSRHLEKLPKQFSTEFPSGKDDMVGAISGRLGRTDVERILGRVTVRKEKMREESTGDKADAVNYYEQFLKEVLEWRSATMDGNDGQTRKVYSMGGKVSPINYAAVSQPLFTFEEDEEDEKICDGDGTILRGRLPSAPIAVVSTTNIASFARPADAKGHIDTAEPIDLDFNSSALQPRALTAITTGIPSVEAEVTDAEKIISVVAEETKEMRKESMQMFSGPPTFIGVDEEMTATITDGFVNLDMDIDFSTSTLIASIAKEEENSPDVIRLEDDSDKGDKPISTIKDGVASDSIASHAFEDISLVSLSRIADEPDSAEGAVTLQEEAHEVQEDSFKKVPVDRITQKEPINLDATTESPTHQTPHPSPVISHGSLSPPGSPDWPSVHESEDESIRNSGDDLDDAGMGVAEQESSVRAAELEHRTQNAKQSSTITIEDIPDQLDEENAEFARFVAEMGSKDVSSAKKDIEEEMSALNVQRAKERRDADDITGEMITETQELLHLFGIPYITAPMEAEAQCASLLLHELVDGIITDDSDVFLFGGGRVYKNFFNQAKYVECYLLNDLEREMNLNRESLVSLAYFTGSDYTQGIHNVGPVIAMEIMGEWSGEDGLEKFAEWWRTDVEQTLATENPKAESKIRRKLRKLRQKLDLPADFPDPKIRNAYLQPIVDESEVPFEWGIPDLDGLRDYLIDRLGWAQKKADEHLLPVIRQMNQRKAALVQTNLERFFDISAGFSSSKPQARPHKSARVQTVVEKMKKSRGTKAKSPIAGKRPTASNSTVKRTRKKNVSSEPSSTLSNEASEISNGSGETLSSSSESDYAIESVHDGNLAPTISPSANSQGTDRGRGRGRGRNKEAPSSRGTRNGRRGRKAAGSS